MMYSMCTVASRSDDLPRSHFTFLIASIPFRPKLFAAEHWLQQTQYVVLSQDRETGGHDQLASLRRSRSAYQGALSRRGGRQDREATHRRGEMRRGLHLLQDYY